MGSVETAAIRRSEFGKETTFLWEGCNYKVLPRNVILYEVPSTFTISPDMQKIIDAEWNKVLSKDPEAEDGNLWRTEKVRMSIENLFIDVSPIKYSYHRGLRNVKGKEINWYPNPIAINPVQVTDDGYILLGVRGGISDSKGMALIGAGFIGRHKRIRDNLQNLIPIANPAFDVQRECLQETAYKNPDPFDIAAATPLCVVRGSSTESTIGYYLPIKEASKEVGLGNSNEFTDLIFLPDTPEEIGKFLSEGGYKGVLAADHLIGCLESYLACKKKGLIK